MGRASKLFKKRVFNGDIDGARKLHADTLNKPCGNCKTKRALTTFTTYMPQSDLYGPNHASLAADLRRKYGSQVPVIQMKDGPWIRYGQAYACVSCTPAAERALAHTLPSHWILDRDYGPAADVAVAAVAAKIESSAETLATVETAVAALEPAQAAL